VVVVVDLDACRNVQDAFAGRAAAEPERCALTVLGSTAQDVRAELGRAELDRRARARAARLAERFAPGERVLFVLPTGTAFVELYLGCLYAGLVAVPAPEPTGSNSVERVAGIVRDCTPALVVTTAAGRADLETRLRNLGFGHVPVEKAGEADPDAEAEIDAARRPNRESVAVIQYSSGSTGEPKGVVLTHGALLNHTKAMAVHAESGPDEVYGSWLPLHHDMGLFAMLTTGLLHSSHVVLMAPSEFIRRPAEWLRMLALYGCTTSAGPNFAFDLCVRAIPDAKLEGLDLSRLRHIWNGAEPINPATVAAFSARFAPCGLPPEAISPCYGLAEATAYVSTTAIAAPPTTLTVDPARLESVAEPRLSPSPDGRAIMGLGQLGGLEARIVEPRSGRVLPEGAVGEIWLRGAHFGSGYWNKPELTARTFNAHPVGEQDAPGWLRTGDLGGFLDGELFVTGRIKELLVVHGRNLFPQDVEREARAAHNALEGFLGAAFAVAAPDERVVLVHEINPSTPRDELPTVATAVARRLMASLGVPVRNLVLVKRGTVRRTTSGKIQRTAMRERFLAGSITALHAEIEPAVRRMSAGGDGG
jgi:acyl-CoA synthetase (AMP-forming)/AMP-acid ligase II